MAKLLWKPTDDQIKNSNMYRFMNFINEKHDQNFAEYSTLYRWSVEHVGDFWAAMWEFADIIASKPYNDVIDDVNKMPGARWYSGARLNFAENLLRYRDNQVALIIASQGSHTNIRSIYADYPGL